MGELNKTDERNKKIRKRRTEILLGIVLLAFIIYKFSLYNYFSFVGHRDAKTIIRDFERNYLYSQSIKSENYKRLKNEILSGSYTTKEKLDELFQTAKSSAKDNYTSFKYADIFKGKLDYSAFKKMKFESKTVDGDTIYVKLNTFGAKSGEKFYKALDKSEGKDYLIVDLRTNDGGDYSEAVQIADMLLPEGAEICNIEHMNSKHYYTSDAFVFDFKKIFVLLDEKSASSAEMLTLTLKENLGDKVEIIGKATAKTPIGKYYKSYYNKIDFDIVTYKWFVKGKSAEDLSMYLGKYTNSNFEKLEDYMSQVKALKK